MIKSDSDWLHEKLDKEVEAGFVAVTAHPDNALFSPEKRLFIYNYTPKAQYEDRWNEVTLNCRGLILNPDREIVARPFRKFFNYTEKPTPKFTWSSPPVLYEKLDGSLGIIYPHNGGLAVATRGSFSSRQAVWASHFVYNHMPNFSQPEGITTLVEIIYPENRIVVDYKGESQLVLLGAVDNATGKDIPIWEIDWWDGPTADNHGKLTLDEAYRYATSNEFAEREGIVAVWHFPDKPAFRLKFKHPEYVRMHKIMTGISSRLVWLYAAIEDLKLKGFNDKKQLGKILGHNPEEIQQLLDVEGPLFESLIKDVPDEFYKWICDERETLIYEFERIHIGTVRLLQRVLETFIYEHGLYAGIDLAKGKERSKFAKILRDEDTAGLIHLTFNMLDGGDVSPYIWKMIKPERYTLFEGDNDGE